MTRDALDIVLLALVCVVLYTGLVADQQTTQRWEARISSLESDLAETVHQNERCDHQVLQCQANYIRVIHDIERMSVTLDRCIVLP